MSVSSLMSGNSFSTSWSRIVYTKFLTRISLWQNSWTFREPLLYTSWPSKAWTPPGTAVPRRKKKKRKKKRRKKRRTEGRTERKSERKTESAYECVSPCLA